MLETFIIFPKFLDIVDVFFFFSYGQSTAVAGVDGKGGSKRVVCYYTNWSAYRPGPAKFLPQNINPYLCTHLIYAFGGFTNDFTLRPFDKWQDIDQGTCQRMSHVSAGIHRFLMQEVTSSLTV